jgi:protein TonB
MPEAARPVESAKPVSPDAKPLNKAAVAMPEAAHADASPKAAPPSPATASQVVTAPRFDADYLDNPSPAYPPLSRREGEEGTVMLSVYVEANGQAGKVELARSSGFERLDRAALAAVKRWRFVPAGRGADAMADWVRVPIVFSLKE